MYTAHFHEYAKLLAAVSYDGVSTEQNTSWLDLSNYARAAVIIITDVVGTDFNADIEISETGTGAGTNVHTLKSLTEITADESNNIINIRGEELSKPSGATGDEYRYLRVETTPDGACNYIVVVLGLEPRYAPVGVTEWDEVVT